MKFFLSLLFCTAFLVGPITGNAASQSIKLASGDEIPVERYAADGDTLIIWTPSDFGMQPTANALAQELVFENLEIWLADLHTGFFVSRGHGSVNQFDPPLLEELIEKILHKSGKKRMLLMTTGSGARPVLKAARLWQLKHKGSDALAGILLFHPSLYAGRPELGKSADYLPVVRETNLPIFIFQPTLSTTHYRVNELQQLLQSGGSQVYLRVIEGVRDGYHVRPDDDLSETDRKAKSELATQVGQASRLLLHTPAPRHAAAAYVQQKRVADTTPGLRPYHVDPTPPLALVDIKGTQHRLADYRGKVVLVSFWASWCPPCVREMPSMNRLQKQLGSDRFRILGVNIGERKADIEAFLKSNKLDFTVLLDPDRKAYDAWKVYVVPSNFIVDGNGEVHLGSVGGIAWDSPEVVQVLEKLVKQTAR